MKKLFFCFSIGLLMTSLAGGQSIFKINQYNTYYNNALMPVITLFSNYQFNKKLGITSYFYVNAYSKNSWGEGLAGVTYTPVTGVSVGFLAGLQSNETEIWRVSPIIMLGKKQPWAFLLIV